MKRIAVIVISLLLAVVSPGMAHAAVKPGASCPKAGRTAVTTVSGIKTTLVCTKVKARLVWRPRATAAPTTSPSPTGNVPQFTLPTSATVRTITRPDFSGRSATDPTDRSAVLARLDALSADLDASWIEVDSPNGPIPAAVWRPKGAGPFPVLVFLHGTGGMIEGEYLFAADLARNGYQVVVPCWWRGRPAPIETTFPSAQLSGLFTCSTGPEFVGANGTTVQNLLPLLTAATQLPKSDGSRLGVVGTSRGATLALLTGSMVPAVKSVVAVAAPFNPPQLGSFAPGASYDEERPASTANQLTAPTLVMAGTADTRVPVGQAMGYEQSVVSRGKTNIEFAYIEGGPHQLLYPPFSAQVRALMTAFLSRTL